MKSIIMKIKRRETPFWAKVYNVAKAVRSMSLPSWKPIHKPLYYFHVAVKNFVHKAYQGLWVVPAFRARCQVAGKGIRLPNGMPEIMGDHLIIKVGDDTQILDSTLSAGHLFNKPKLTIGDRVTVGYHSDISVAQQVFIGSDTVIAKDCYIADNDGHQISPKMRRNHLGIGIDDVDIVTIGENCWIGCGAYILKGANIGTNSIVAANAVVLKGYYPPNSLIAGNPAKVVYQFDDDGKRIPTAVLGGEKVVWKDGGPDFAPAYKEVFGDFFKKT